jgi:hypothetical protein
MSGCYDVLNCETQIAIFAFSEICRGVRIHRQNGTVHIGPWHRGANTHMRHFSQVIALSEDDGSCRTQRIDITRHLEWLWASFINLLSSV